MKSIMASLKNLGFMYESHVSITAAQVKAEQSLKQDTWNFKRCDMLFRNITLNLLIKQTIVKRYSYGIIVLWY